jgi:hypothetical protein
MEKFAELYQRNLTEFAAIDGEVLSEAWQLFNNGKSLTDKAY